MILSDMCWDWEAFRAYIAPVLLTVIALFGIAKDSKEYKERAHEPGIGRLRRLLRARMHIMLYGATFVVLAFGLVDIHSTRKEADEAKADRKTGEGQIQTLQKSVNAGNSMLTQQRQDFLKQFALMSDRVEQLQTQVKTADLEKEAEQLRSDLAVTRKAMEVPKARLSFTLVSDNGDATKSVTVSHGSSGSVRVKFRIDNNTDVTAAVGEIVLVAFNGCKIIGNPSGFEKGPDSTDTRRYQPFQHLFARSEFIPVEVEIMPPLGAKSFFLGMEYRCQNCENYSYHSSLLDQPTLPSDLFGTVMIRP